jgi:hypothetical protein
LGKPGKGKGERGKEKRVGGVSVSGEMKSGDGVESAGSSQRTFNFFKQTRAIGPVLQILTSWTNFVQV